MAKHRYIKTFEELNWKTYQDTAGKLQSMGHDSRAERLVKHSINNATIAKMHVNNYQDIESFSVVINPVIQNQLDFYHNNPQKIKLVGWSVNDTYLDVYDEDGNEINMAIRISPKFYLETTNADADRNFQGESDIGAVFPSINILNPNADNKEISPIYFGFVEPNKDYDVNTKQEVSHFRITSLDGGIDYIKFSNRKDAVRFKKMMVSKQDLFGSNFRDAVQMAIDEVVHEGWYKDGELTVDSVINESMKSFTINSMVNTDYRDQVNRKSQNLSTHSGLLAFNAKSLGERVEAIAYHLINDYEKSENFLTIMFQHKDYMSSVIAQLKRFGNSWSKTQAIKFVEDFLESQDEFNDLTPPDLSN